MNSQLLVGSAERVDLDADGHRVAALRAGPANAPAVLLVPGYTGSKEDFAPVLDPLGAAGYRVVAIDLPGQFESPPLPTAQDYTPDRLGVVVSTLAASLGPRVRLLGHSFGGLVARAAVIESPDLFDSLVLLSSGPAAIGGERRRRIEQLAPVLTASGLAGVYAASQATAAADPAYVAPPAALAVFLEQRFMAAAPNMLQGMGDALRCEPDRVAELAAVGIRTLVVHGVRDDAWLPATQQHMAARLGAEYAVLPGAAHSAAVENPTALLRTLIDFWAPAPG